jgi:hypothetical protein
MNRCLQRVGHALCLATITLAGGAAAQDPATDLSDLNYQDTGWSRSELLKRGYQQRSQEGGGYEYWWNSARSRCIVMRSDGNKVASVVTSPTSDCGQSGNSSSKSSGDNAAAVAIGAAAILGIAALAHKSHHHDDDQHGSDSNSEADFERGYRDGLYNQSYDTYSGNPYQQGYASGSRDRTSQTSYRGYSQGDGAQVTCESTGNQHVECPMDTRGEVRVVRQLSHSPCTQGVSWGLSKHAVWVERGCRAVFQKN